MKLHYISLKTSQGNDQEVLCQFPVKVLIVGLEVYARSRLVSRWNFAHLCKYSPCYISPMYWTTVFWKAFFISFHPWVESNRTSARHFTKSVKQIFRRIVQYTNFCIWGRKGELWPAFGHMTDMYSSINCRRLCYAQWMIMTKAIITILSCSKWLLYGKSTEWKQIHTRTSEILLK